MDRDLKKEVVELGRQVASKTEQLARIKDFVQEDAIWGRPFSNRIEHDRQIEEIRNALRLKTRREKEAFSDQENDTFIKEGETRAKQIETDVRRKRGRGSDERGTRDKHEKMSAAYVLLGITPMDGCLDEEQRLLHWQEHGKQPWTAAKREEILTTYDSIARSMFADKRSEVEREAAAKHWNAAELTEELGRVYAAIVLPLGIIKEEILCL